MRPHAPRAGRVTRFESAYALAACVSTRPESDFVEIRQALELLLKEHSAIERMIAEGSR